MLFRPRKINIPFYILPVPKKTFFPPVQVRGRWEVGQARGNRQQATGKGG